jgi:hypothetical protein
MISTTFGSLAKRPPEKLEAEDAGNARVVHFQFLASLHHFRSGWRANHALNPPSRYCCNRRVSRAGSLSLGR